MRTELLIVLWCLVGALLLVVYRMDQECGGPDMCGCDCAQVAVDNSIMAHSRDVCLTDLAQYQRAVEAVKGSPTP